MTHDDLQKMIADQDRRLSEAMSALRQMSGSVSNELVAEIAHEFERIADLTQQISTTNQTSITGLRA